MSSEYKRQMALRKAYKRLFNSEDGLKVMEDLKARLGYDKTVFNDNPYRAACNEGGRSALCYIIEQMDVDKLIQKVGK